MAKLENLKIASLHDHPDNPRIAFRQDVIDGIAASINGKYPQEHAIIVRPIDGGYQIVAGHHRKRSAEKAGLKSIWAWVGNHTDGEAYEILAKSNNQDSLSLLEIGIWALGVDSRKGKSGNSKASIIGKSKQIVSMCEKAAKVYLATKNESACVNSFDGKTRHLFEIASLPKPLWPDAVNNLGDRSVVDVKEWVDTINAFIAAPPIDPDCVNYLPVDECGAAIVSGAGIGKFTRLSEFAIAPSIIDQHKDLYAAWWDWLVDNKGCNSWDLVTCREKRAELEDVAFDRSRVVRVEGFELGDFEVVAKMIPNESLELIFTDPPYDKDSLPLYGRLAKVAMAKLKPGGSMMTYLGQYALPEVIDLMIAGGMKYLWQCYVVHTGQLARMNFFGIVAGCKPVLWFVKGSNRFDTQTFVNDTVMSTQEKDTHPWQQSVVEAEHFIEKLTTPSGMVFDPFCGGGTTAIAARRLGRKFLMCDVNGTALDNAKERFNETFNK